VLIDQSTMLTELQKLVLWQVHCTEKAHCQKSCQVGSVGRQHDHAEDAVGEAQQPDGPAAAAGLRHLHQHSARTSTPQCSQGTDRLALPSISQHTACAARIKTVGARART
jgi:hypothetical protein